MKALLVTSLRTGGPLEHSIVLAGALRRADVSVSAVCADEATAARFATAGADPIVHPLRRAGDLSAGLGLRKLTAGFDVVHAQDRRSGLWTRILPRHRGEARVYTVHGLPDPYLPPAAGGTGRPGPRDRLAYSGLDVLLARRGDAVVVPSRFLANELVERLGYPSERMAIVPNGIEPLEPTPPGDLVGTVSMLEPVKGLDVFVRAAATVREKRRGTRFAIFGDGSERRRLEGLSRDLGVTDSLAFRGHVPVGTALAELRLYVLCSWLENCPMALLEAMGAGRPAVATEVGGVPEIAGPIVPMVPAGDPDALAAGILGLLDDTDLAATVATRSRERVLAEFTADRNAAEMVRLYERLREGVA